MRKVFSTHELAEILGVQPWKIQRLFQEGCLPEPDRFAGKRAIPSNLLPAVVDALRSRGWLPIDEVPLGL